MKRYLLAAGILAGLTLAGGELRAQTGTARGKVVDDKDQPVADVSVKIEFQGGVTRSFETRTGKKGDYTQVGLPPGVYRFTAAKDGYQGTFLEAKIALGDVTYLPDIKLAKRGAAAAADTSLAELRTLVEKAIDLTNTGKLDEAEALYKEAIGKHPTRALLHCNLAIVYLRKKDNAAAEAAYLKAIEVQPDYLESYSGLSNVYLATGRGDKALELISKTAADRPDDGKVQLQHGIVLFNAGKQDEAADALRKALTLDPSLTEAHYYLGSILVGQGKVAECIAELEAYLAASPSNPQNVATAQGLIAALKPKK